MIDLPDNPQPEWLMLRPRQVVGRNFSPFTGHSQVFAHPGKWWELEVTLPLMDLREEPQGEEWISALITAAGGVPFRFRTRQWPDTIALGRNFQANVATVMQPTPPGSGFLWLDTGGNPAPDPGLQAGDWVSVNGHLMRVSGPGARGTAGSAGTWFLPVFPGLRQPLTSGATLQCVDPYGRFHLIGDPRWEVAYYGAVDPITFVAREVIEAES